MHKHLILVAGLLIAATSHGQTIVASSELPAAEKALATACGGAWSSVMPAVLSGKRLAPDEARTAQIRCLLEALGATTFDARNQTADQTFVDLKVDLLLGAYTPDAYDGFATHLGTSPDRVRHGLLAALVDVGQPDAMRAYFADRRKQLDDRTLPGSLSTPTRYRALLTGRCSKAPCSPRLAESLMVVRANLDVAAAELHATLELTAPVAASAEELQKTAAVHREAGELIQAINRIERGEATIGKVR
jgi:hypothetical protein